MINLQLCERPLAIDPPNMLDSITSIVEGWKRSIRAVGGYWLGSFSLHEDRVGYAALNQWFDENIGRVIRERTAGIVSWEGLIIEMTLIRDGIQYRRTLDREWWHNKVKVLYRDAGASSDTGWNEITDSSDIYGELNYIDTIGESTAAAATALRETRLADFAYPRARLVGGLEFTSEPRGAAPDRLDVTIGGFIFTLNWRYRTTSIESTGASTALTDLVNDSEFVSPEWIDSNTLSVDVDCATPQRLWDAVQGIIAQGDASGNRWVGGVYQDREFHYNAAATNVTHFIRNGLLVDAGNSPVIPSLLLPDIIVRNADLLSVEPWVGSNAWDDPRNAWITEVEFIAPDGLVLKPSGFEDVDVLKEQLT